MSVYCAGTSPVCPTTSRAEIDPPLGSGIPISFDSIHRSLDGSGDRTFGGKQGGSLRNAPAETINGLYKTELIYPRGPWKTRESVEIATLQWVHWFNHQRLLEPIGYIPPAEAEAQYWRLTPHRFQMMSFFNPTPSTKIGAVQPGKPSGCWCPQGPPCPRRNRGSGYGLAARVKPGWLSSINEWRGRQTSLQYSGHP